MGLEKVNWCASRDENTIKEQYRCSTITMQASSLTCAATTGKVFAISKRPSICEESLFLLNANLVAIVLPAMKEKGAAVFTSENLFSVVHDTGSASVKRMNLEPVDFSPIVKNRGTGTGTMMDRESLMRGCHHAQMLSGLDKFPVLTVKRDGLQDGDEVNVTCSGMNGEFQESVTAPGEDLDLRVGADQLLSCLAQTGEAQVRIVSLPNAVYIESGDLMFAIGQVPLQKASAPEGAK